MIKSEKPANNIFAQLRLQYTEDELSYFPGDNKLRYQLFAPFFENLFENKVVYYEKDLSIVRLEDIDITLKSFHATAIQLLNIEREGRRGMDIHETWQFGGPWSYMRLIKSSINMPYAGWTIWPEAGRVQAVEALVVQGRFEEALSLTINELAIS